MPSRLLLCATCLQESEEQLLALLKSLDLSAGQKSRVAEALSFVQQARFALSESENTVSAE